MAHLLQESMSETHEIIYVFANTGFEHEETLIFLDKLDKDLNLNLVWLEAKVMRKNVGTKYKRVTFETASRWQNWNTPDHPFIQVASKYGVPHRGRPHCTRELKIAPMYSYINEVWPERNYNVAIGIRSDEMARRSKNQQKEKIIYPLMEMACDKEDVNIFWEQKDYTLNIPESHGNCLGCFKKSPRKLADVYKSLPNSFDLPRFIENMNRGKAITNGGLSKGIQAMYTGWRYTDDMVDFLKDNHIETPQQTDLFGGCSEECGTSEIAEHAIHFV